MPPYADLAIVGSTRQLTGSDPKKVLPPTIFVPHSNEFVLRLESPGSQRFVLVVDLNDPLLELKPVATRSYRFEIPLYNFSRLDL